MKKCAKCGQEYGDDKKYCLRCGLSLEQENKANMLICGQCETVNKPDFNFCKKCGTQLATRETQAVSEVNKPTSFKSVKQSSPKRKPDTGSEGVVNFRDALRMLLKNTAYEMRANNPHVHLGDGLGLVTEVKKELFNKSVHDELLTILNEWGIDEQGVTISSRIYQNTGLALKKESPDSIQNIDEDGTIWLNSDYEFKMAEHITNLTANAKVIWAAHFYMSGIIDILSKVMEGVRNVKSDEIEVAINQLKDAKTLLPNEKSITDAIASANKIRDAISGEEVGQQLEKKATVAITASRPKGCAPNKSKNSLNYVKLAVIGIAICALIIGGFFLKSFLTKPTDQPGKKMVQKPAQPQQPVAQPNPAEQQPTATVEPPTGAVAPQKQPVPAGRVASDQRPKKQDTVTKAKQQPVQLPKTTKEQKPRKEEKKSFAPHSRDDL